MRFNKTLAVAAGAAAFLTFGSAASAQTAAAAKPAPPAVRHGAAIPGVCVYTSERAIGGSEVGQYVGARMKQILAETNSELKAEEAAIKTEAGSIDAARATLTPDVLEKRTADLQVRFNAFQRKQQLRQSEVQATERKAVMRVLQELDPIAVNVYQSRNCAVLLGDGVLLSNPAMDITDQVIQGLNAKIKSFTFNRERLDTPPAAAAPRAK